jgi:hypothetical protein
VSFSDGLPEVALGFSLSTPGFQLSAQSWSTEARRRESAVASQEPGVYFFLDVRLRPPRFRGTFPPSRRASLNPIAMACLRLVTLRPDRPERREPRLRLRIAPATFRPAFLPYFAIEISSARHRCKADARHASRPYGCGARRTACRR